MDPDELSVRDRCVYSDVRGKIEANLALRVCRLELWNVNALTGWHLNLANTMAEALWDLGRAPYASFVEAWAD